MGRKMRFRFLFSTEADAQAFADSLKRLPGAFQEPDWSATAQITQSRGAAKGRQWERYAVRLSAPGQASQELQQIARQSSAIRWEAVETGEARRPGQGRFDARRHALRRGGHGKAKRTSRGLKKTARAHKGLGGDEDTEGY